ncbi:phosphotriesterase [Streptomyces eurocidicus]|uniref:Phosphotriesterase n=1 Tax=Streptomyces eurocidicus TaxID=66423 RepID=A0A2N8NTH5_STREU|nr:phosphotriesterase [Streptomyces eurocidicus]MBB5121012.1 phosphotriesterase-related protein [Streptomyces eurocidicus]MBF6055737.1 phosphotriesterase [Streptomyces eurocidicus]PNE32054.1 phosphotriesterase [Streptomyces eurocidicus]
MNPQEAPPAGPLVRTVLGDLPPGELGVCDAHDHLFLRTPLLPGQELADPVAAASELRAFREAGGRAVAQWTPRGMGRRRAELAALARATGIHLVAATGLHQAAHYTPESLGRVRGRLAELFVGDLTTAPVRAGLIKVAGGFHGLDAHARWVMAAAAEAHHATGAPVAVHLELGTGAAAVLDVLCGAGEVPPDRVILGHLGRSADVRAQLAAARSGAYLAFDGPSRAHHPTDWRLFDSLAALAEAGHGDRILLGGDTTTAAARAVGGGGPGMPYLLTGLRPALEAGLGGEFTEQVFVANPARAFAARWR